MTTKFGNFENFIVRNFVVIWEKPLSHHLKIFRRHFLKVVSAPKITVNGEIVL